MRKLLVKKNKKKEQQKANRKFQKDPYGYSKRLLDSGKEKQQINFSKSDKDTGRDRDFKPSENMNRPPKPASPIPAKPPTWKEVQIILKKCRNKSAPGPNGVSYLFYKNCRESSITLSNFS